MNFINGTIGIVGNEEAKFTSLGRTRAFDKLVQLIDRPEIIKVVSGGCHLGGIDKWAIQVASELGKEIEEFLPEKLQWEGGYKQRNIQIAEASEEVHCLSVNKLPENYSGMKFEYCYHCHRNDHIKSGGCWTILYAKRIERKGFLWIIENF